MSDSQPAPTHSASWHYERAEECLSWASHFTDQPTTNNAELVNPEVQKHLVEMAKVHAQLAEVGATLMRSVHSAGRADLLNHATGFGYRDV